LTNQVRAIADFVRFDPPDTGVAFSLYAGDRIAYYLVGEGIRLYDNALADLMSLPRWSDRFSRDYLQEALRRAIESELVDRKEETGLIDADAWLDKLDGFTEERSVYLQVVGLALPDGPQRIGNVEFIRSSEASLSNLRSQASEAVSKTTLADGLKPDAVEFASSFIDDSFANQVAAVFVVCAEPARAIERAEEEVRRAIDVLRFSVPALYGPKARFRFGLKGDVARATPQALTFGPTGMTLSHGKKWGETDYELSNGHLARLSEIGVLAIGEMLQRPANSLMDIEVAILRAVHWISSAQIEPELENKLLNLSISMEVLLTPRDGNPIGTAIAEGVAILVGADLENRRLLKKEVKRLYALRSSVSHGGRTVITNSDVRALEKIAVRLATTLVERREELKSTKNLLQWIEDQKLS
jgi:hypothetical protein